MGGVGFLVQCRLELLKVPYSLGLEFWNNYYFNLLKIAFLLKIIELRQAAKHALIATQFIVLLCYFNT